MSNTFNLDSFVGLLAPLQFSGEFLYYALVFFVLALVAAFVGFRGVAGISMEIARIFVLLFVVLAIVAIIL
ncbi:DUF1328 domain-containing protein [Halobium salinum]|uniref:UPF0391 membrane protein ACFO0N_15495 n=1 Tax=Halobium salinum TaxID=1364940 RepID=A0ABD5PET5_9EURY|nr:DUF1328 domain-containing protein [Halobium salinum]